MAYWVTKIFKIIFDFTHALVWCVYGVLLGSARALLGATMESRKLWEYPRLLIATGVMHRYAQILVDQLGGRYHLAMGGLQRLIETAEQYRLEHHDDFKIQKLTERVMVDWFEKYYCLALKVGDVEQAMAAVIMAKSILDIDELSTRVRFSVPTAQMVQVAIAAARSLDDRVLATVIYRSSPAPDHGRGGHSGGQPSEDVRAMSRALVDKEVERVHDGAAGGSMDGGDESFEMNSGMRADTNSEIIDEQSRGDECQVIPFPVKRIRPSTCLSGPDRDNQKT